MLDLLVLGSGIAGLSAAIRAADAGLKVTVLTKGAISNTATNYAQGGVAAALDATAGDPVLVVGSLYLVGDLFAALGKTAASLRIYEEG